MSHKSGDAVRHRRLVEVTQWKAPYLVIRDWRRAPRYTALGGLLNGTLRFEWKASGGAPGQPTEEAESAIWGGLGDGPPELWRSAAQGEPPSPSAGAMGWLPAWRWPSARGYATDW